MLMLSNWWRTAAIILSPNGVTAQWSPAILHTAIPSTPWSFWLQFQARPDAAHSDSSKSCPFSLLLPRSWPSYHHSCHGLILSPWFRAHPVPSSTGPECADCSSGSASGTAPPQPGRPARSDPTRNTCQNSTDRVKSDLSRNTYRWV